MLALSTTAFRSSFSSSRAATKPATLLNSPSSESKDVDRSISETKQRLFAQCAACDRGFGAVERERTEITMLVNQLSALCVDKNTTRGLFPDTSYVDCPIEGCWKLIYTDALDVLSLAASPFTLLQGTKLSAHFQQLLAHIMGGRKYFLLTRRHPNYLPNLSTLLISNTTYLYYLGIYQKIDRDGSSVNIIDLAPRLQALLPPSLVGAGSTLRLRVGTSARARSEKRVGLTFRSVEAAPLSLAGQSVSFLPPLQVNLPQVGADSIDIPTHP
jgi:hypothetical protein